MAIPSICAYHGLSISKSSVLSTSTPGSTLFALLQESCADGMVVSGVNVAFASVVGVERSKYLVSRKAELTFSLGARKGLIVSRVIDTALTGEKLLLQFEKPP